MSANNLDRANADQPLQPGELVLPRWLVLLLATSIGVVAANLYYAQPLVALISQSIGLSHEAAGLVVTLTQIGYGTGVLFLVPLGDIVDARNLILTMICIAIAGICALAFVTQPIPYFMAAFVTGVGCAGVQVIVPYAAHFSTDRNRGQVIGSITSGLMMGIMLSRPIASLLSDLLSWHAVFVLSAILMSVIVVVLWKLLPPKKPSRTDLPYLSLVGSMLSLLTTTPILRERSFYQAMLFGTFCFFWTAAPLLLGGPVFGFSQTQIAIFALVGITGAVAAPLSGRAADRGWTVPATFIALVVAIGAYGLTRIFELGSTASIVTIVAAAILLDACVSAGLVLGQRAIFHLGSDYRSRLNALYIASIFIGGGTGSTLGAWSYARGGWPLAAIVGAIMPMGALIYFIAAHNPWRTRSRLRH